MSPTVIICLPWFAFACFMFFVFAIGHYNELGD